MYSFFWKYNWVISRSFVCHLVCIIVMFGWINKKRLLFLGSIQWSNPWQILCNEGARSEIPLLISYWVSNDNKIAVYICQRKQKGSHLGLSRSRYLHHEIQITYIEKFFYLGIFLSKYILNYSSFYSTYTVTWSNSIGISSKLHSWRTLGVGTKLCKNKEKLRWR